MTPTEQALTRELARHPAWVWTDGMRVIPTRAADGVSPRRLCHEPWKHDGSLIAPPHGHVLDLADPATQGCLAAALEPWLLDVSRRRYMSDVRWTVTVFLSGRKEHSSAPTFGEAIARAWLAVNGGSDGDR